MRIADHAGQFGLEDPVEGREYLFLVDAFVCHCRHSRLIQPGADCNHIKVPERAATDAAIMLSSWLTDAHHCHAKPKHSSR